jgi:hypothetical protein
MLGNGDGTFGFALPYNGGARPAGLVVGDFNGDGKPDFATADLGPSGMSQGSVSIFLNQGNGTFHVLVDPLATSAVGIAAGDLNGDSKLDLVVLNQDAGPGAVSAGSVSVLLGNGDGTFQAPVSYGLVNGQYDYPVSGVIALGDVTGDHHLDIVVASDQSVGSHENTLLLGNGDGTFQTARSFTTTGFARAAVATDLNGDGKADLVVANDTSGLQVLLSNGDGTFASPVTSIITQNANGLAAVDLTGNGKPDLIVSNSTEPSFNVLINRGDGNFPPETDLPGPPDSYYAITATASPDLNGDHIPDLVIASNDSSYLDRGPLLQVFFGKGDGTFEAPVATSLEFPFYQMTFADLNHDGKLDLIGFLPPENTPGGQVGQAIVKLGNGDGTFSNSFAPSVVGPERVVVGDFNHDGNPDLAFNDSHTGNVRVFLGKGDGTFQTGGDFSGAGTGLVAADFNGDGKLDLATGIQGGVQVFLGNGDGTFRPPTLYQDNTGGLGSYELAVGDFNRDGIPDLITGDLFLLLGNGDGTFRNGPPIVTGEQGNQYEPILVADVNNDGNPDLVEEQLYDGGMRVLVGNGDATFQPPQYYALPGGSGGHDLVADFTGDGKPDLVHDDAGGAHVTLLTNTAPVVGQLSLDAPTYSVNENAGSVTLTVQRTGPLDSSATIHYDTSDCTESAG